MNESILKNESLKLVLSKKGDNRRVPAMSSYEVVTEIEKAIAVRVAISGHVLQTRGKRFN